MAAAWLAKEGRKVGVFERLSFFGGRYTELDYHGYAVTTAAWTSLGERCNIGRFLKDVGADVRYITLGDKGATHQSWIWFKDGRRYSSLDQVLSSEEMRGLLRAQSIPRQRCPEVLDFLVNARVLNPAVGGYTLDPRMLP